MASAGMEAVGRHKLAGVLPLRRIFQGLSGIGRVANYRSREAVNGSKNSGDAELVTLK